MSRLGLVVALAAAGGAWGKELSKGESWVLEGTAFYKTNLTAVRTPPPLVEGTLALERLFDELRPLLPPEAAAALPAEVALPAEAAQSSHVLRAGGRWLYRDFLQLSAAYQLSGLVASHPAYAQGSSLGALAASSGTLAKRRLWDFSPTLLSRRGLRVDHNLDELALKLSSERWGHLVVGRQVLSWGAGRLWNPTDLLSPFAPTDVDREVRRGIDAVRASIPLGELTQLELVVLPLPAFAELGGAARLQTNAGGFDVSASAAKYVRDAVLGADLVGDVGPFTVHAEAAWTLPLLGLVQGPVTVQGDFLRAVGGASYRPHPEVSLLAEYHFNGAGAPSPAGYVERLRGERVARGEVFGAGRHYLGLTAAWAGGELWSLQGLVLANLADASALLLPSLEYSFEQTVLVRAGAYLPLGRPPDAAVFQRLSVADVVLDSDAFREATRTFGLRSEFGASPLGAFVQVGLYLP